MGTEWAEWSQIIDSRRNTLHSEDEDETMNEEEERAGGHTSQRGASHKHYRCLPVPSSTTQKRTRKTHKMSKASYVHRFFNSLASAGKWRCNECYREG